MCCLYFTLPYGQQLAVFTGAVVRFTALGTVATCPGGIGQVYASLWRNKTERRELKLIFQILMLSAVLLWSFLFIFCKFSSIKEMNGEREKREREEPPLTTSGNLFRCRLTTGSHLCVLNIQSHTVLKINITVIKMETENK